MEKVIVGNHAVSYGAMLSRVQLVSAYPISPQTTIVEELSELCASGEMKSEYIKVESEHSAMACCIGAASVGVRTFTATSAQGLALMHEELHWAAGARLPIVMVNVTRAMSPPWNMWCEQTDSLSQRDTGWLQFYCESNQEALDTIIQAYKISEQILLPSMVMLDGFILSHTYELVDIPDQERVYRFLPMFQPRFKLDVEDPHALGGAVLPDIYFEQLTKMQEAMDEGKGVAEQVDEEFYKVFGRRYGVVEDYRCEGADLILVTSGTISSTTREVVDACRCRGEKVGMLKIKMFRPFPTEEVEEVLSQAKKVAVIDRNISFGRGGIFAQEVKSALFGKALATMVFGYVTGLGGRDVTPEIIQDIIEYTKENDRPLKEIIWMGLNK